MLVAELKTNLISKIAAINDFSLLEDVKKLLDFESDNEVYHLNKEQKKHIAEAKKEYESRNVLSNEDANNEIAKWLEK